MDARITFFVLQMPLERFGTEVKKSNGREVDHAPKVWRDYMKDNPRLQLHQGHREFDELILKFQRNGTDLLKRNAELEVSHRKKCNSSSSDVVFLMMEEFLDKGRGWRRWRSYRWKLVVLLFCRVFVHFNLCVWLC